MRIVHNERKLDLEALSSSAPKSVIIPNAQLFIIQFSSQSTTAKRDSLLNNNAKKRQSRKRSLYGV
jgi:hypothetical protein